MTAYQYSVHFKGYKPDIHRARAFDQYNLSRDQISAILDHWSEVAVWVPMTKMKIGGRHGYHPTAIKRVRLSAPIREYIKKHGAGRGLRVLYHGMGQDDLGLTALGADGSNVVIGYDPYHPLTARRRLPAGRFEVIHSHYTLNVVDQATGRAILAEIGGLLQPGGRAVVTVRRDL